MKLRYRVELYEDPEEPGVWIAKIPSVKGVYSDGYSCEEALIHVREALEGMLAAMKQWGRLIPSSDEYSEVELVLQTNAA